VIAQQLFRRGFLPEHANWAYILQTGLCGQGYWDFVAEKLGESSHEINDPADASDVIADLLLKAAQNGGFPAVKLLIRGAVATFASEYGKTKEEIEALPEPDEDILRDLSEAVLTPAYAQ
jgi:hypothetical protein